MSRLRDLLAHAMAYAFVLIAGPALCLFYPAQFRVLDYLKFLVNPNGGSDA